MVDSDVALHEIDEVPTLGLVGCSGDEGGRRCKYLGQCGLGGSSDGPQTSFPNMGRVRTYNDSSVRTPDTSGRGQKAIEGLNTDQRCEWLRTAIPGYSVKTSWNDPRGSISCFPRWVVATPVGTCRDPCERRLGGGHCHGIKDGSVPSSEQAEGRVTR